LLQINKKPALLRAGFLFLSKWGQQVGVENKDKIFLMG